MDFKPVNVRVDVEKPDVKVRIYLQLFTG